MKNYFYPRTFCRLFIFFLVSIFFSCSKNLEYPLKTPANDLEKAPPANYNYAINSIDTDVLLSLKQDTLFKEFVWLLDYSYITHLTDSLRKATNNQEMFYNCYLEIMKKRTGTILERFNMVKNQYPEDFFKYVIHQSSAKKTLSRIIDQSLDTMHIDGIHVHTDEFYFEQAAYYNDINNSIHTLASRANIIFRSEIIQCNNSTCRSYERLIWSTFETIINSAIYPDMRLIYDAQYLSNNLTQTIIGSHVRMAIDNEYIECIPINEFRERSDYCIGVIISSIEWNGNFKVGFLGRMNCNMYDHWEPDDGGTTNPPTNPNTETEVEKTIRRNAPKASKIINLKSNLTIEQWKEIEEIFGNMVRIDKIVDKIKTLGGDNIIHLKIDPDNDNLMLGWNISLKLISYSSVAEEFFHAYQRACIGPPTNSNCLNREFEAKFYTFASEHIAIGGTNSFPFPEGECSDIFNQWFDSIFEDFDAGRPVSKMSDSDYNRMMQSYKENAEPPYNDMEYEPNYGFDLALDLFKK